MIMLYECDAYDHDIVESPGWVETPKTYRRKRGSSWRQSYDVLLKTDDGVPGRWGKAWSVDRARLVGVMRKHLFDYCVAAERNLAQRKKELATFNKAEPEAERPAANRVEVLE